MSRPMVPVNVGDVIRVGEPDYMDGRGSLILRVTKVGSIQRLRDGEWLDLEGVELREDGSQFGRDVGTCWCA